MFDAYGIENTKIELIEEYSCDNLQQLRKREGYHIQKEDCINKRVAGRTLKEYRDIHKDKMKIYLKQYYKDHKEVHSLKSKEYRETNKEKIAEYHKKWWAEHKDDIAQKRSEPILKERIAHLSREYNEKHKERIRAYRNEKLCCPHCEAMIARACMLRHTRRIHPEKLDNLNN
jgi:hypothetical protein